MPAKRKAEGVAIPDDPEAAKPTTPTPEVIPDPPADDDEIPVDFMAFQAAHRKQTQDKKKVRTVVRIPVFEMDEDGDWTLAEDQRRSTRVLVTPEITANAMAMIGQLRMMGGSISTANFVALVHPSYVETIQERLSDLTNPVPLGWLHQAVKSMLAEFGLLLDLEPAGKAPS